MLYIFGAVGLFALLSVSNAFSFAPRMSSRTSHQTLMAVTSPAATSSKKVDSMEAPCPGNVMTLTRFMIEATRNNPDHADMESLIASIQMACKTIANLVSRAGISDLTGLQAGGASINIQGEEQKKLDVISNNVLKNALRFTGKLGVIASEEEDHPVLVEEAYNSKYVAVFDPLDGSSNIDAAISTGTIFGIFKENDYCLVDADTEDLSKAQEACLLQTLQPGDNLVIYYFDLHCFPIQLFVIHYYYYFVLLN